MYDGPLNWPYVKASPATYRLMRLHCNIVATILEGWQAKGLQLEALTKRMVSGWDEHRTLVIGPTVGRIFGNHQSITYDHTWPRTSSCRGRSLRQAYGLGEADAAGLGAR